MANPGTEYPSAASGAVFLSYAREDTAAARRITEALQGFGVEVWFDQSELRGGERWDEKIRAQIRACTLFLPIISAHTQARREGYFRREWKLAVERTGDMAAGVPFLVPVVVDDTAESRAIVPAEFLRVQWMRLPAGLPTPQFIEQVKRLFGPDAVVATGRPRPVERGSDFAPAVTVAESAASPRQLRLPSWWWAAVAIVVAGIAVAFFATRKAEQPVTALSPPVAETKSATVAPAVNDKSIAVLPFTNLSPDKANEFFADGIHEEILTNLQNIRELLVISRTSVMGYRGTAKKIREIAQELGVASILEGSVRREGNTVRVSVQLIDGRTDKHIWSPKPYDRNLTGVFAIQSELAHAIADALHVALSPQEKTLLDRRLTEKTVAYDFYLQGRELMRRPMPAIVEAEKLFQAAVELDPKFSAAWSQLCYVQSAQYLSSNKRTEHLERAKVTMDTAMRLAPDSPEVIRANGDYHYYGLGNYAKAAEQYERLLRLQPNDTDALHQLSAVRRGEGRWLETIAYRRKVAQLDPGNLYLARALAETLEGGRRYAEAMDVWRRIVSLQPDDLNRAFDLALNPFRASGSIREAEEFLARMTDLQAKSQAGISVRKRWALLTGNQDETERLERLSRSNDTNTRDGRCMLLAARGDMAGARALLKKRPGEIRADLETAPASDARWAELAEVEALLGHTDEALRCARKAGQLRSESVDAWRGSRSGRSLAFVYAWTGSLDLAVAEYQRLLRKPNQERLNVYMMKHAPEFAPLRGHPRWEALLSDPKNNTPLF